MIAYLKLLTSVLVSLLKSRGRLEAEVVLLRHQLNVLRRAAPPRLRFTSMDRLIFVWLYRLYPSLLNAVGIIKPATVLCWIVGASGCPGAGSHGHRGVDRRSLERHAN